MSHLSELNKFIKSFLNDFNGVPCQPLISHAFHATLIRGNNQLTKNRIRVFYMIHVRTDGSNFAFNEWHEMEIIHLIPFDLHHPIMESGK